MYFKDADKPIRQELKQNGRLVMESQFKRNYPFCWRSDTPLMYRAIDALFIKVTAIKEDMIKNNSKAYWVPKQVQERRFDSWLKNAEDWYFSRSR
jgi:isoleucyl-tRNA synthetase